MTEGREELQGRKCNGAVPFDEGIAAMYRAHPNMATEMLDECIEMGDREALWLTFRHLVQASLFFAEVKIVDSKGRMSK